MLTKQNCSEKRRCDIELELERETETERQRERGAKQ